MAKTTKTFEGVVGRLRSIVGDEATAKGWMDVTGIVSALEGAELDKAVDYLEPTLAHWRCEERRPWIGYTRAELKATPFWWVDPLEPTLRVAPFDWMTRATRSFDAPQMRLVEGVDFRAFRSGVGNKGLIAALEDPSLARARTLRLGATHGISMTAYKHLATGAGTEGLRCLSVADFRRKHLKALDAQAHLDIRHLCVHATTTGSAKAFVGSNDGVIDDEVLERFLGSSWFRNVETLSVEAGAFTLFRHVRERELWPDLHTIELKGTFQGFRSYGNDRRFHVTFERVPPCHTLRLVNPYYPDEADALTLALSASPQNVTHLDLSSWLPPIGGQTMKRREQESRAHDMFHKQLRARLPTSNLLASVEEITLGHWHSDLFAADIEHHGTRVVG